MDGDGDYVVVGAPGTDSASVMDAGAAYAFYELDALGNSGLPSTWVRSSGSSGGGRLYFAGAEGAGSQTGDPLIDQYQTADRLGRGVTISGTRIMVGLPGHNEPTSDDNGGFLTFTTDGQLPAVTLASLRAEILPDPAQSTTSNFGSRTAYDASSRTLFVASPGTSSAIGTVDVYVNEGLSWRYVQTLSLSDNRFEFGVDLDADAGTLVVGAPSVTTAHLGQIAIYERDASGENWSRKNLISGQDWSFGSSVAVSGDLIVVGAPSQTVQYKSDNQPASLDPHRVTLTTSGAAFVYKRTNGVWGTTPYLFLMPDDSALPESWLGYWSDWTTYDSDSTWRWSSTSTYGWTYWDGSTSNYVYQEINSHPHLHNPRFDPNYDQVQITIYTNGFLNGRLNMAARGRTWQTVPNTFSGLDNAGWGTSVDIIGNLVVVGAPGRERVAVYNLSAAVTNTWTAYAGGFSADPLRTTDYYTYPSNLPDVDLGTELGLQSAGELFVGFPGAGIVGDFGISSYTLSIPVGLNAPDSAGYGIQGSIAIAGNRMLMGGPGGNGGAGFAILRDATSNAQIGPTLLPFNTLGTANDTAAKHFGVGASIVSEGHYVVGTKDSEILYNFRQRGPAWSVAGAVTVPEPIERSKLGSDIAIDGDTAVLGAKDYDNAGAAFVFQNDPRTGWTLQAILQSDGIALGDDFGSSVAISGDTIVVGAPGRGSGAACVFERLGTVWQQAAVISHAGSRLFGNSVGIDVDTIVVGSVGKEAAYVFSLTATGWSEVPVTLAGASGSEFGTDVAIDAGRIVVGAPNAAAGKGSATVYVKNGASWTLEVVLFAADGAPGDHFGQAVSISGSSILIGASGADSGGVLDSGAAYFFENGSGGWAQDTRVALSDAAAGDGFGFSVTLDGDHALIGAPFRDVMNIDGVTLFDAGQVFAYGRPHGQWGRLPEARAISGNGARAGDNVGYSVAIDGNTALLGAPQVGERTGENIDSDGTGYVYVRSVSPPRNVTELVLQQTLIAGAQANVLHGTLGGNPTATLNFFDIAAVSISTGSHDDQFTIGSQGLTAYGLANFTVTTGAGDDTMTVHSGELAPPAVGNVIEDGDFGGLEPGEEIPEGLEYVKVQGEFFFDAGAGTNTLVADANVDWTLQTDRLSSGDESMRIANFNSAWLLGGDTGTIIKAESWSGPLVIDGRGGSDQITVCLATVAGAIVADSAGAADRLTIFGTEGPDIFRVFATSITMNPEIHYAGIEEVRIGGLGGDDTLYVLESGADSVVLDGNDGSDTYQVEEGLEPVGPFVSISDSGPAQGIDGDEDTLRLPASAAASGTANGQFPVGNKTVLFDDTIEVQESNGVPSAGTPLDDTIVLNGGILTINGNPYVISTATALTFDGLGGNDTFIIVRKLPTLETIDLTGGDGIDLLIGPDGDNTWHITGPGQGSIDGDVPLVFRGMESLTGGADGDTFLFSVDTAAIEGDLDGGEGADTLTYAGRGSAVSVDLADESATAIGGRLNGVENLVGTSLIDDLTGQDATNEWNLGIDAGTINSGAATFSSFENLTGGASADSFILASTSVVSGVIDGGAGDNRIELSTTNVDDVVVIDELVVSRNGSTTDYLNIGQIDLSTLGGLDAITVNPATSGFPTTVTLSSGDGDDEITVNLAAGASTTIIVNGGASSAGDSVIVIGTADADGISVDGLDVKFSDTVVTLIDVENLTVAGGEGEDQLSLTGTGVTGNLTLRGEAADDVITLDYPITTGTLSVDGGTGTTDRLQVNLTDGADTLSVDATTVQVLGQTAVGYSNFESLSLSSGAGADDITIVDTHSGATVLDTGTGSDSVAIHATSGVLEVYTGDDADTVNVHSIGATATLDLGAGNDTVNVSSNAPGTPGTLGGIAAELVVNAGEGTDALTVDNRDDQEAVPGRLTRAQLTGLGMAAGIAYYSVEDIRIALGAWGDHFTIESTCDGTNTVLSTGAGGDVIEVGAVNGPTTIDAGDGSDFISVAPSADGPFDTTIDLPAEGSAINGMLTVDGGGALGGQDELTFTTVFPSIEPGNLTSTQLTGLQMPDGIAYTGVEVLRIVLATGSDIEFTVASTHSGTTSLTTDSGGDTINIQTICGATTIHAGSGNDTINVGSLSPATVNGIAARLTVRGDEGEDTLNVDDTGDALGGTGILSAIELTGLGMPEGIGYETLEHLDIGLGSGGDTFTIEGTHSGTTTLAAGAGSDTVNVRATDAEVTIDAGTDEDTVNIRTIGAAMTVNAGSGDDTINVGSNAPGSDGTVNAIGAPLTINGEEGEDTLNVDDSGDTGAHTLTLSENAVIGLGMSDGITYEALEHLNIGLGSGGNTINIRGTSAAMALNTGAGDDTINVGSLAPAMGGTLNGVYALLTLNGQEGNDILNVDDSGDTGQNTGTLTEDAITGLGMSGGIRYGTMEQLEIFLGSGGDQVSIEGAMKRDDGFPTMTMVNTGAGDDSVAVSLDVGVDGFFALNTEGGDDFVDAAASTLPLVIFGGEGSDTIHGGQGNDVILGDRGRVDYRDEQGNLKSRLGIGLDERTVPGAGLELPTDVPIRQTDGVVRERALVTTRDAEVGGADSIYGNNGSDIVLGGAADDTIEGGAGSDVILGDNGVVRFDRDGDPATLDTARSTDPTIGGSDTIFGGEDFDIIFGGTAGDEIHGGGGHDILLGDHGLYDSSLPADQNVVSIFAADNDGAGNDTIHGDAGDDFILGQQGDDTLYGDAGEDDMTGGHNVLLGVDGNDFMDGGDDADVILGDNGTILRHLIPGEDFTWERYPGPFADVIRDVSRFDDIDLIHGDDTLCGGPGDDIIHGQRGDDTIDGGAGEDEIYGELGDDTITGGAGGDIILGDVGTIVRDYNEDGTPRLNTNGAWHRDVFLEEVGYITGVIDMDTTPLRSADPELAEKIFGSDLLVLTGAFAADGGKYLNSDNGAWDTDLYLIDLVDANNDTIDGGDGEDVIFGQRGSDTLSGGDGADLIFGDGAINLVPFETTIPQIYNGIRLIGIAQGADVPVSLPQGGTVITAPVNLLPDELTDFYPTIEFVSDVVPEFQALAENSALARTDGASVVPYITIVPDVVHHTDVLQGNETIDGGSGDDLIFGDNASFSAPMHTGVSCIDDAREDVSLQLADMLRHLRQIAVDFDVFENTLLGVDPPTLIEVGNDTIIGGTGNDTLIGDNGTLIAPATVRQGLGREGDLKTDALELFDFVRDVEWMATDFDFLAKAAHLQVLDSLVDDAIAHNPRKTAPKEWDVIDLGLRDLVLQTDIIYGDAGDDLIVGDNALMITPVAASETLMHEAGNPLDVGRNELWDVKKALDHEDWHRDGLLKDHIRYDHGDFDKCSPTQRDQYLIRFRAGYDYAVGNDILGGGAGNDLVIGDSGVVVQPGILEGPMTKHDARDLNQATDLLMKDADDLTRDPFAENHCEHDCHGNSCGGCDWWGSEGGRDCDCDHSILNGSDVIDAGSGNDVVFGDNAVVTPVFAAGDSEVRYEARPDKGWGGRDCDGRNGDDVILGGDGIDILFGQQGEDTLDGGDGDDTLYGGSGRDTLLGGAGNDKLYGGSDYDRLNGGLGRDEVQQGGSDGGSDGGIDAAVAMQNPWLKRFILDLGQASDTIDGNSLDWLTFKGKGCCCH